VSSSFCDSFAVGLIKKLNEMLGIETKLSTAFYPQTDEQMERTNQELEWYLKMYINYRQSNWLEWLTTIGKSLPSITRYI